MLEQSLYLTTCGIRNAAWVQQYVINSFNIPKGKPKGTRQERLIAFAPTHGIRKTNVETRPIVGKNTSRDIDPNMQEFAHTMQ